MLFAIGVFFYIKSQEVNMRQGPDKKHRITQVFKMQNWPLEYIRRHENWVEVKDLDGSRGWIHINYLNGNNLKHNKLSDFIPQHSKRYAVITKDCYLYKYKTLKDPVGLLPAMTMIEITKDKENCYEIKCNVHVHQDINCYLQQNSIMQSIAENNFPLSLGTENQANLMNIEQKIQNKNICNCAIKIAKISGFIDKSTEIWG